RPRAETAVQALAWLESAPLEGIDYFIIDSTSQILASSRNFMTTDAWKSMKDAKYRNLCEIMCYEKLRHKEDYATFTLPAGDGKTRSILAHFLPLDQWEYTIALAVDISDIEAEAQTRLEKILNSLNEFSRQLNITKNGFVYMFDADDAILIPPPDHIRNDIHLSGNLLTKGRIYDDIKSASESEMPELQIISSNDPDQSPMMVYCRYFKPLKWYISVFVPLNEINTPARILVTRQSLIITALFMAGLGVVIVLVIRIAAPLKLLSAYAEKLPEQDFSKPLADQTPIDDLPQKYRDEVGGLAQSFIFMRQQLSLNILNLISITASRQRIESELNIAREIQLGMIPKTFPPFPQHKEFDLYATLIPAKEIGGDLYDFFLLDKDHLCFTLGDVSDKGIHSALMMVITRTLIRTLSENEHSPCRIMARINTILSADNPQAMFVTLIIGILDIRTGEIRYANGGHNPPIMIPREGEVSFKKGLNEPLVGAMPGMTYSDLTLTLLPGESFFLYTDGVNEAMNSKGEQFSNSSLLSRITRIREKAPEGIIKQVLESLADHAQGAPQSDDIAMLIIKYNRENT
ncbi:MAG: serine/threonine protein phosphatase, partial [Desulfobacterales bacterium RIFOXYA12_FULL_46_15]